MFAFLGDAVTYEMAKLLPIRISISSSSAFIFISCSVRLVATDYDNDDDNGVLLTVVYF